MNFSLFLSRERVNVDVKVAVIELWLKLWVKHDDGWFVKTIKFTLIFFSYFSSATFVWKLWDKSRNLQQRTTKAFFIKSFCFVGREKFSRFMKLEKRFSSSLNFKRNLKIFTKMITLWECFGRKVKWRLCLNNHRKKNFQIIPLNS